MSRIVRAIAIVGAPLVVVLSATAGGTVGCGGKCDHPDHVVYDRDPQSADQPGCVGDTDDVSYPEGTTETLPECLAAYPGPATCNCQHEHYGVGDGGVVDSYEWSCPI